MINLWIDGCLITISIIIIDDQFMDRWVFHYHFSCLWWKWNETRWTDKPIIFQSSHLFSWLLWKWDFSNFAWKLPLTFICTSFSDLDMFSRSHRSWTGKLWHLFFLCCEPVEFKLYAIVYIHYQAVMHIASVIVTVALGKRQHCGFLWHYLSRIFKTLHEESLYCASVVHTSFGYRDQISRSEPH